MNEQDERIIYEWAGYADIEARVETIHEPNPLIPDYETTHWYRNGYRCEPPPALDMNFAFDVCVPKLLGEKLEVTLLPGRHRQYVCIETTTESERCKVRCNSHAETMREAFYTALLAYIKGIH